MAEKREATSKHSYQLIVRSVSKFDHTYQVHLESEDTHVKLTIDVKDAPTFHVNQPVTVTLGSA